ncbi:MAG: hypothetical protein R3B72_09365 [Polyangiaceae bacterium]
MSKKQKSQTSQRRNAARRARRTQQRTQQKHQQRRARPSRERGRFQSVTATARGIEVAPIADLDTYHAYLDAHRLVPTHPMSEAEISAQRAMALFTLEQPPASSEALLRAVMILAHTPDPRALAALRRHAASGAMHADLAVLAADECAMWLEQGGVETPSEPRSSATLN